MTSITAGYTIDGLRLIFAQHGLSEEVVSDNGPQFVSNELAEFMNNSETQRLVQNVILKLDKINIVFVKPLMVKHP